MVYNAAVVMLLLPTITNPPVAKSTLIVLDKCCHGLEDLIAVNILM